ncbi:SusC/RagA family TonB-linked outer membrane protein [Daejeonella oryzae]|uniref:SusC/RagA family TonB-linked outer membrane protein n=1 Tax=Daejeonella oryzae TaxID=1122943 RepID=UPI0003F83D1F|nr:SusC/RagA family TonB-linked outer membrane protein [Daejeonella oryzae]
MKKLLQSSFLLLFIAFQALAQERIVTGTVTAREDGLPLPGVTIKIKGTQLATSTNSDGKFNVKVPANASTLVFSFLGFKATEVSIPSSNVLNIALESDAAQLSEVIVTALGESREKKSLGYSVQEVKGENLTVAKSVDVSSSLAGKIAGVQLQGSPSSSFDNANIIIRGISGLDLSNANPLYVVDGTVTAQENVIMDNVESISVLKGAAATALYGNRAGAGVVIITSKKGSRSGTPSIDVNLSTSMENLYIMPKYQNSYAGGYSSNSVSPGTTFDNEGFYLFKYKPAVHPASWASFDNQRIIEYGADESWGPLINGQDYRPYYSWYPGSEFGQLSPLTAQPNNVKDFFDTGRTLNNSIAFSGGTDAMVYRLSYNNLSRSLTQPGAKRNQHQIGLNTSFDISKKLTVMTDIAYTTRNTKGQPQEGYLLNGLNVAMNFNQWFQRQLDVNRLKNYRNDDGSLNSWNIGDPNSTGDPDLYLQPQYWDSPYFVVQENYGTDIRNRIVGNMGFKFKINDIFNVSSFVRMDYNNGKGNFKVASGGLQEPGYSTYQLLNNEMNYEANLNFKKGFGDITIDGFVGGNIRTNKADQLRNQTTGGLTFPNYFDIAGSVTRPITNSTFSNKEVRSIYGKASFGYKTFFYVDATLRNDWSSALPVENNSYLYPSLSTSLVFSELISNSAIKDILSFGKFRAAFAQVGSDLDPYRVDIAINNGSIYGNNPSAEIGNQFRTGAVLPSLTKSYEVGTEMRFFNNKIGFDLAYYVDNITDQILGLDIAPASGFTTAQINAGNIQRKGWELSISGSPVSKKNFSWNTSLNFAKAESIVKELAEGLDTYLYNSQRNDFRIENQVGKPWGQMVGRMYKTDAQGNTVYTSAAGTVDYTINNNLGSVMPDFTGGFFNNLKYKGVDLSFSVDFQKGGQFYSLSKMYGDGTGLTEATVGLNDKGNSVRMFPSLGGGVHITGVTSAGAPLDTYIAARRHFYTNNQRDTRNYILSSSYLKLREVSLGFNVPKSVFGNVPLKNVKISAIVNNAWLIAAPAKEFGFDPSELEEFGREGGQLSSTRTFGLNLKVGL